MIVLHSGKIVLKPVHDMIMRSKKRLRTNFQKYVLSHGPGNAKPVICAGSPADLIKYHKAFGCRIVQYIRSLVHLHHKCALPRRKIIMCADPCKYPVHNPDRCRRCGNKTACLRHKDNQCHLPHISGFPRHIRPCYDSHHIIRTVKICTIGNKPPRIRNKLNCRMPAVRYPNSIRITDNRLNIIVLYRNIRERRKRIKYTDLKSSIFHLIKMLHKLCKHFNKKV